MSLFGQIPLAQPRKSAWCWYPWAFASVMVLVWAVNGLMAYEAISTFPGAAVQDEFGLNNRYDHVLEAVARQNALGWTVRAEAEAGHPVVRLADARGAGLGDAVVTATAARPIGPDHAQSIVFQPEGAGLYVGGPALPLPGRWDLMLRVRQGEHEMRVTRRVVVR